MPSSVATDRPRRRALRTRSARRSSSPGRSSHASARATVPPPGGDVIGRRRLDTHIHAFAALGADVAHRTACTSSRADAAPGHTHVPRRGSRHGDGERDHGRGARRGRDDARPRRLRAAHPGSLPLPRRARRAHRGHRVERAPHPRRRRSSAAARTGSARTTSRSRASSASPRRPAVRSSIDDVEPDDLISIVPAFRGSAWRWRSPNSSVRVPAGQHLLVEDDFGGQIPKIESGIWPAFPADLTSIAVTVATQARGTILIFEKMFESRLFFVDKLVSHGRADHPLRPASRRRDRARRRSTASGSRARTSAPAWRCSSPRFCAEGTSTIGNIAPDRPRIRAHRRAPARRSARGSSASTL